MLAIYRPTVLADEVLVFLAGSSRFLVGGNRDRH